MNNLLIILLCGFAGIASIVNTLAIAFIAHKYVHRIEEHLSDCPYVQDTKRAWEQAGLLGKIMRGGIIGTILLFPTAYEKRGFIDRKQVENLPTFYRKIILIPIAVTLPIIIFLSTARFTLPLIRQVT